MGRLNFKTAIIDNFWSALRMDKRVIPTAAMLVTKPWVVVREYIHGHRIKYTQPVRFIVIICFLNIFVQMIAPDNDATVSVPNSAEESFWLFVWHSVQAFLRDSKLAVDIIDSVVFAPVVYLLFLPWGSGRFNLAEYSTAYLYLCGGSLVIDLLFFPLLLVCEPVEVLIQVVWWLYVLHGMVKHSFKFRNAFIRTLMLVINIFIIVTIGFLDHLLLLGE